MKFTRNSVAILAAIAMVGLYGCGTNSQPTGVSPSLDTTAPSAPADVSITSTITYNDLAWTASSAPDLAKYEVYQYQPDPSRDNSYMMIGETTQPSFRLAATSDDMDAIYRVRAVDQAGNRSAYSSELNAHLTGLPTGGGGAGTPDDPTHRIEE